MNDGFISINELEKINLKLQSVEKITLKLKNIAVKMGNFKEQCSKSMFQIKIENKPDSNSIKLFKVLD